jgi:tRNA G18 (ribose-2'-O)-methylase SpoU
MQGFFGVGIDGSNKIMNAGNLLRTTHAFGGSFFFFVRPSLDMDELEQSDTARSTGEMPVYRFNTAKDLLLPSGCSLVGVELTDDAVDLPNFRHPKQVAYVLGPEKGNLSPEMQARCDHIVKIPMKFCVNVGIAGAIVIYDRMISLGRKYERPVHVGGPDMIRHLAFGRTR